MVMMGVCKWCGEPFEKKHPKIAYCCEEHRKAARQEQNRNNFNNWYLRNKNNLPERCCLGSGGLGRHRNPDFDIEQKRISREMVRLSLRKK